MTTSIHVSTGQVAASLALVALAAAISFWRKADLDRDIAVATVRSLVQLTAIGYAIKLIFESDSIWLIFFPGTMVGMLLAGANPTDAVRLQLILLYTLLGSVAIASLIATTLAYRNFFTSAQQLRELEEVEAGT
jgi:ABC-type iron transport system FetAB permease component